MNAIELQMMAMFQHSAEPIAKKYDIRLEIDWNTGGMVFITEKDISQIQLQQFLTEMTAVIQKCPFFQEV